MREHRYRVHEISRPHNILPQRPQAYPAFINVTRIFAIGTMIVCLASSVASLAVAQPDGITSGAQFPALLPV